MTAAASLVARWRTRSGTAAAARCRCWPRRSGSRSWRGGMTRRRAVPAVDAGGVVRGAGGADPGCGGGGVRGAGADLRGAGRAGEPAGAGAGGAGCGPGVGGGGDAGRGRRELVVALLAVLKAGAAYLPVDPAYPAGAGRRSCSADAGPVVMVTGRRRRAGGPGVAPGRLVLVLDDPAVAAVAGRGGRRPARRGAVPAAAGASGVRDLHVGVDRAAEGRGGGARGAW